jgi:deoxyribodipyrimidine photolyase
MTDQLFRISQLGTKPTRIGIDDLKPVERLLFKFANEVIKKAKDNLQKDGINASNALSQSISALPIEIDKDNFTLEIDWANYGKYVDQGVQGKLESTKAPGSPFKYRDKMPPRKSLEDYITNKAIDPIGSKGDRLDTREELAKFMQVMTYRYGTKRTLFFSNALTPKMQEALINDVAEALGKSISISMKL